MHARATTPQRFGAVAASTARPTGTVASRSVHESPRREGRLRRTRAPVPLLGLARPSTSRRTQQARSAAFRGLGAADPSRRPSLRTGLRSQGHMLDVDAGLGTEGACACRYCAGGRGAFSLSHMAHLARAGDLCVAMCGPGSASATAADPAGQRCVPSDSRAPRPPPFSNHTHVEAWARAARADDTESALARAPQPARPSKTHMET